MTERKMKLPEGWYPHNQKEVEEFIKSWKNDDDEQSDYKSGIVPHAGWFFSGEQAWKVISRIPANTETIILAGGHLYKQDTPLCWDQDAFETPLGNLVLHQELFKKFCGGMRADDSPDNTIEIQLPLIKYRNPGCTVLPVRLPPSIDSYKWGLSVADFCKRKGINAFFLGSTDLTHYGYSYGNLMYEDYPDPIEKAREMDSLLLNYLTDGNTISALESVEEWQTACSLGGALGALGFAKEYNRIPGKVLSLTGSYEKMGRKSDFVNYGSVIF